MSGKLTIISSCEFREKNNYSKNYEPMSRRLVHSIRTNGGKYKDCRIVMWYSEEAAPSLETTDWLIEHGCDVIGGKSLGHNCEPVGNKIMAVNTPVDTEFSLWIDTDMYLLDPVRFEELLEADFDVSACGSNNAHHRWASLEYAEHWAQFYELAGVDAPAERFTGYLDGLPQHVYFNSCFVLYRNGRNFPETWKDLAIKVRNSGIDECEHNFTQTSLTLAVLKTARTYRELPFTYNAVYCRVGKKALEETMLHYQDNIIDFDPRVKWNV
ncbi:MAG: hypothetical protein GF334_03010 [Candidatus Altiarchaeales archaeon]|nr:hypothetical protein [Candidatus Altiarchaeales archaeon]